MYFRRMEDLRIDNNLTQVQVASLLHCHRQVYRRYEKGIRDTPVDILITLAELYETSVDYLVEITDIKDPYTRKKTSK